jgi:hypothetical protein
MTLKGIIILIALAWVTLTSVLFLKKLGAFEKVYNVYHELYDCPVCNVCAVCPEAQKCPISNDCPACQTCPTTCPKPVCNTKSNIITNGKNGGENAIKDPIDEIESKTTQTNGS